MRPFNLSTLQGPIYHCCSIYPPVSHAPGAWASPFLPIEKVKASSAQWLGSRSHTHSDGVSRKSLSWWNLVLQLFVELPVISVVPITSSGLLRGRNSESRSLVEEMHKQKIVVKCEVQQNARMFQSLSRTKWFKTIGTYLLLAALWELGSGTQFFCWCLLELLS